MPVDLAAAADRRARLIVATIGNPLVFLLAVNLLLLVVGCFMEALAAMLILIPILVPAAAQLGIDPIAVRPDLRAQPDDRHDHAAGRRRALRHLEDREDQLRGDVARDPAVARARSLAVLAAITLWPPLTTWLPRLLLGR